MPHQARRKLTDGDREGGCYPTSGPPSNGCTSVYRGFRPQVVYPNKQVMLMAKPKYLFIVNGKDIAIRELAILWQIHARKQVEDDLRRKGIKRHYISAAQLTMLAKLWMAVHSINT